MCRIPAPVASGMTARASVAEEAGIGMLEWGGREAAQGDWQRGGRQKEVRWFIASGWGQVLRKAKKERHKSKAAGGECIPLQAQPGSPQTTPA